MSATEIPYSSAGVDRARKIASLMQRELSDIMMKDLADPRMRAITITNIRVSKDLKHAKVHVSGQREGSALEEGVQALNHAAPYIRRQLGGRLSLKYTPSLRFLEDVALRQGARVASLIDEIADSGR